MHLRTNTAGLLPLRPDPVWLDSPQLETAFRSRTRIMRRLIRSSTVTFAELSSAIWLGNRFQSIKMRS
jgi:hypothetical protein